MNESGLDEVAHGRASTHATFALLIALTVTTTWALGKGAVDARLALLATFGLVAVKVALVMLEFMELRRAHPVGRAIFLAWAVALSAVIVLAAW